MSLIAHLVGDYILQTDHMAQEKTKKWWPAIFHGITYGIPFAIIGVAWPALLIIVGTHIVIDRYRLAKYLVWFKNQFAPKEFRPVWKDPALAPSPILYVPESTQDNQSKVHESLTALITSGAPELTYQPPVDNTNYVNKATGYSAKTPDWMAVWLMIIADNAVHIVINTIAILAFGMIWVS